MSDPLAVLQRTLGYRFRDPALLVRALSHSSSGALHNERLEFLGDAVLEAVISADLFLQHPEADEGVLSRWRAALVNGEQLAELARGLRLGEHLRLGPGEIKTGGRQRDSLLADAFEALIGAVFVDGGYQKAARVIRTVFGERLGSPDASMMMADHKSRLQEELQARGFPLPLYKMNSVTGPEHAQVFRVLCELAVPGICTEGEGGTRRAAEQAAAARALDLLPHD